MDKKINRQEFLKKFGESLDESFKAEQSKKNHKYHKYREDFFKSLDNGQQEESIKIKIPQEFAELFEGVETYEEFEKIMDELKDTMTPQSEIYQQCREDFRSVLDSYIVGTIPKENALLLLKSKYDRLIEEVYELEKRNMFVKVDDVPEQFIDITMGITAYYGTIRANIESIDVEKKNDSFPIVDSPEKAQLDIGNTFALLIRRGLVAKHKEQYWLAENSTVPKIINSLIIAIKLGSIAVPEKTEEIADFIKTHIRDKTGKDIKNSVDAAISRAKKSDKK